MRYYYQYETDGTISVRVKSAGVPAGRKQIASDTALPGQVKVFDSINKEIIFYKYTFDEEGEVTGTEEDTSISRVAIAEKDILE